MSNKQNLSNLFVYLTGRDLSRCQYYQLWICWCRSLQHGGLFYTPRIQTC